MELHRRRRSNRHAVNMGGYIATNALGQLKGPPKFTHRTPSATLSACAREVWFSPSSVKFPITPFHGNFGQVADFQRLSFDFLDIKPYFGPSQSVACFSTAIRTSWLLVRTPVRANNCWSVALTDPSEILSLWPISLLLKPSNTPRSTSCSRSLRMSRMLASLG